MFSRFTEKAIQAIMIAQEEAKRFQHSYVGTEHILLGILGDQNNVVVKILKDLGFSSEQIKVAIEEQLEYGGISNEYGNIPFTQHAKQVLTYAWDEARKLGHNYVNLEHLFLSIFRDPTSLAARVLTEIGVNVSSFKDILFNQLGGSVAGQQKPVSKTPTPTLDLFGRDLTWLARDNKLDPVIGRSKEIDRMIQILSRRTKNNPVLTGDPGVGKTAIVEGLAQKIIKQTIPEKLMHKRVVSLDLGLMVAGTKYRGEFEDRVKKVMEEARKAGDIILFIDELHTIIGTGGSEGSLDAANLLKPALARGELQCVGATTLDEYRKHIEGDGALERRFQKLMVDEPTQEETLLILKGIREKYEDFHKVKISDFALDEAVFLSSRYITERHLPDKAVDVIDEAAAKVMLQASAISKDLKQLVQKMDENKKELALAKQKNDTDMQTILKETQKQLTRNSKQFPKEEIEALRKEVTASTIAEVVSNWTGIPVQKLTQTEVKKLSKMDSELKKRLIGQDTAIKTLANAVKRSKVGLKDPNRPTGSFLFIGPSGVGKSELAKELAHFLFGDRENVIRIDMSEFMEKHTVSKLIGAPPGYVGFNEGGQLTEKIRRKPYSVVLFDELEKASPDVTNILLQILEDGHLTDSNGRKISFKNSIIIMTSNVGSKHLQQESAFGFVDEAHAQENKDASIRHKINEDLKKEFKPEFLNRIDEVVMFNTLNKGALAKIIGIMLEDLKKRVSVKNINISYDEKVKAFLVDKGFDPKMGARPLRRAIQEYFENVLSEDMLGAGFMSNVSATASVKKNKQGKESIAFKIVKEKKKLISKTKNSKQLSSTG
ncbi:MAG: ATP-dependent Clp protease ATP-binding subunit [bacterium]